MLGSKTGEETQTGGRADTEQKPGERWRRRRSSRGREKRRGEKGIAAGALCCCVERERQEREAVLSCVLSTVRYV